jgi:RNA chaperone Hfq
MSDKTRVAGQETQNNLLNELRKTRTPVAILFSNGITLPAVLINAFDNQVVVVRAGREPQLVYKSSIVSIEPLPKPAKRPRRESRPSSESMPDKAPKEVTIAVKRRRRIVDPAL